MIPDLPEELETEILSRVPAKSLAKLKTTCKRWYALFRDPSFVKKIFAKAASDEVIILMNSGVYSISLGLDALQNSSVPTTELTSKLIRPADSTLKIAYCYASAEKTLESWFGTLVPVKPDGSTLESVTVMMITIPMLLDTKTTALVSTTTKS
ncbi:F-box/kelch-repeat protein [Cardamine amara subsp. amara]|uniref:F-box/kelch-repeat protein n=1 Tax=Cardamine amara subsp. amara TaxID=228776 RepID=A0ABD1A739_CARAN